MTNSSFNATTKEDRLVDIDKAKNVPLKQKDHNSDDNIHVSKKLKFDQNESEGTTGKSSKSDSETEQVLRSLKKKKKKKKHQKKKKESKFKEPLKNTRSVIFLFIGELIS